MPTRSSLALSALFTGLLLGIGLPALANPGQVVDVVRQIPMTNNTQGFRDIIIQGAAGLTQGQKVGIVRETTIRNMSRTLELGALKIPVGFVEIIFTQGDLAVAREVEIFTREKMPLIEFMGIMVGDQIDISMKSQDTQSQRGRKR